jgi:cytoskeletal protein RodZ
MAVLFLKDAGGADGVDHSGSMVANALTQLQGNRGLRAVLMVVGLLLVVYGLFAVLSAFTRHFPTQPPSRRKAHSTAELGEQQQQQPEAEEQEQHSDSTQGRQWPRSQTARGGSSGKQSGATMAQQPAAPPPAGDVAMVVSSRRDQQQGKAQQLPVSVRALTQEAAASEPDGTAEFVSIELR